MTSLIPTELDLLGELEAHRQLAINRVRVFETKDGPREYKDPDINAANRSTRTKAEILGYIRQTPQFETPTLVRDALLRAMADPELRKVMIAGLRELEPGLLVESGGNSPTTPDHTASPLEPDE